MKLLIKNGHLIDPESKRNGIFDLLCIDGKIAQIEKKIPTKGVDQVVDAKTLFVSPGFIDLHTHLREPGFEYKETIQSGTEAAAAGGYTTIVCMANTNPVNDNAVITELIRKKGRDEGIVNVLPVGAISKGLEGKALANIGEMAAAGIVGISDDGRCVMDSALMRKAMQYAKGFGLLVISHAEDESLSGQGSINEGLVATELGLPGSPNAAEEIIVARDIALAELTKARLHIAHISTPVSLELVKAAKKRGVLVTCEATPHHFTLNDESVRGYNTQASVRPPLRSQKSVEVLKKAIKEGIVDAIATDHAPHASFEKEVEFVNAAHGMIGLETALPVGLALVSQGILKLEGLIRLMSIQPAKILGLKNKGSLRLGADADLTLFSPTESIKIDASKFFSKARNCPFQGWTLKGKVHQTLVAGRVVYREGSLVR
ncbi:MAG: dihydroorotase [Deltaproteobacteria bacterium]|nr:dihydroorotase [Deltaproteobacteria bacterium]